MPTTKTCANRSRIGRRWEGPLGSFLLLMILFVCADCEQHPGGGTQRQNSPPASEVQRQLDEYDRQLAITQRQLAETERQLAESDRNQREIAAHGKRFEEQLDRWSSQCDRVNELLLRWEKLTDVMEQRAQVKP